MTTKAGIHRITDPDELLPPPTVYVLTVHHDNDSWVSVHRTYDGANRKLHEIAANWGVIDLLENGSLVYGVSYLAVEPD